MGVRKRMADSYSNIYIHYYTVIVKINKSKLMDIMLLCIDYGREDNVVDGERSRSKVTIERSEMTKTEIV